MFKLPEPVLVTMIVLPIGKSFTFGKVKEADLLVLLKTIKELLSDDVSV